MPGADPTTNAGLVRWDEPVEALGKMGPKRRDALAAIGLGTVGDLLLHLPLRYEDRGSFSPFPPSAAGGQVLLRARVADMLPDKFLPGRRRLTEVRIEPSGVGDGVLTEPVSLKWLNARHIRAQIAVGQELVIFGNLQRKGRSWTIWFPEFETLDEETPLGASIHMGRLVPVHPATAGASTKFLRELVWLALNRVDPAAVPPPLWPDGGESANFPKALDRLAALHFPERIEQALLARESLARDEALAAQAALLLRRARNRRADSPPRCGDGRLVSQFLERLPFPLTTAQKRAVGEILDDLRAPHPMTRLLHGDVGSGKTAVAFCAMLAAVESGWRAALMAPTQVLAEQHYAAARRLIEPLGIRVALRTGSRNSDGALPLFDPPGASKEPDVIIGTHALLYEEEWPRLGLAVVDEQHKFGVLQRSRLVEMGSHPDLLVMTATPIPRTLSLTLYGDLDVSVLDELPPGRKPVQTVVRKKDELQRFIEFLKSELANGRQAYLVFPLIEESDKLDVGAVKRAFDHWAKILAPHRVGLMHGRLKPAEKTAVIEQFRSGAVSALVSTTVIEVGVDVPNATIMAIFDAERFGLAQLHQLRGRVGRGGLTSYCVLVPSKSDAGAIERLRVLERTNDGFKIAEADLAFRGAGRLFGTAQSGASGFRALDPVARADLLAAARIRAAELLRDDPELESETGRRLRLAAQRLERGEAGKAVNLGAVTRA